MQTTKGKKMKKYSSVFMGMVVLATIIFGQKAVGAQDIPLTISRAVIVSWAGESGATYRVYGSADLQTWREIAVVATNMFVTAVTNGGNCYFRVQKVLPGLVVIKNAAFGNQMATPATINVRLGSFVVCASAAAGDKSVNTISVVLSKEEAAVVVNFYLEDPITGTRLTYVKAVVASTNLYSVNLRLPAGCNKVIDLRGDLTSNASLGPWTAEVSVNGIYLETGDSVFSGLVGLQTITIH